MRSHVAVLTVVLLTAMVAAAPGAETTGASKGQLNALAAELEAQGGKWLRDEPVSADLQKKLDEVRYDAGSLPALKSVLGARRPGPVGLYVANHLLEPLLRADKDVIAKALPSVKKLHSRLVRYERLPKYTEASLAELKMPPFDEREPAGATMRKIARIDKARQGKVRRELPIARNNEQACKLVLKLVRLMLFAERAEEDKRVTGELVEEENRGRYLYADITDVIVASADRMSAARAKYFYGELRTLGERLRWERKNYVHIGQARLNPTGNSDFAPKRDYPGRLLLKAANKLAAKAQMPEVNVPSSQEVNVRVDQRRKAGRQRSGK